ncbi:hypothetical protein DI272_02715 [Streptomyces sp. Act143]|uniref:hypothetical protein n=1 Tax=Streptomyces sp. Act143 TaxID=2200760 RepID=UPI000D68453D|nr:hypothetical protein [Streptomyces sp. Act143]PWI13163.1 hypothetical protein DI272_02715 [Streptomyces sp. Act143]
MSAHELAEPCPSVSTDGAAVAPVSQLVGRTVTRWLPRRGFRPPAVGPNVNVRHIAARMARTRAPLVAVAERGAARIRRGGAVTAARPTERLAGGS